MELIIGVIAGLLFFISNIIAYSMGVKHGRIVKNDGVPNVNPIKAVKSVQNGIKQDKQADLFAEGLQNILSYGEPTEERR